MKDNNFEIYDDRDLESNEKINLKSKLMAVVILSLSLISIALLLWYGYKNFISSDDTVKLIIADKSEKKIKPQNPGGMEFPDMDKDVFDKFSSDTSKNKVERILPAPEEPLSKKELDTNDLEEKNNIDITPKELPTNKTESQNHNIESENNKNSNLNTQEEIQGPKPPINIEKSIQKEELSEVKKLPEGSNFAKGEFSKSAITKTHRVQLSSLKSQKDAIKLWDDFVKKAGGLLDNKKYFIEKKIIEDKGLFYRLQVADIISESDAAELCKKLKNKNIDCFIVRPQQ